MGGVMKDMNLVVDSRIEAHERSHADEDFIGKKITVIFLCYNHINLIKSSLQSVLDQTITGFEIIVSDDCSTDGTWELVLEMASRDERIRPIQTPTNIGVAGNANFAVSMSNRPYIALLHHDDLYRADLLEKWADSMQRFSDVNFVFNAYDTLDTKMMCDKGVVTGRLEGRMFLERFLLKRWRCPVRGTAMIRRSSWDTIGGMRIQFKLLSDIDMWMRLSRIGAVGYVAETLIEVRHERPEYYPDIYTGKKWYWERQVLMYDIHAINLIEHYNTNRFLMSWKWSLFRTRVSLTTAMWLFYAYYRRRWDMINTAEESFTQYDCFWLRWLRHLFVTYSRMHGENKNY
jgi:glycosyltransferase involved in cell wall biosynthesis